MQISHQSLSGRSLDFLPIIRIFFDTPPINQPGPDLCKEMNKLLFLQFPSIHSQVEAVETIKDSKWNELWATVTSESALTFAKFLSLLKT